jgi:hypothetical protein
MTSGTRADSGLAGILGFERRVRAQGSVVDPPRQKPPGFGLCADLARIPRIALSPASSQP